MKCIGMIMIAVLTLALLATAQRAGPVEPTQVMTDKLASQQLLRGMLSDMSPEGFSFLLSDNIQATSTTVGGTGAKFKAFTCKGRRDCGDLKRSGKCDKGTMKCGTGADKKYGCNCLQKQ